MYRDAEVVPGTRLNLILGPNGASRLRLCSARRLDSLYDASLRKRRALTAYAGTGKSTLVCALCLGLAGKPTVSMRLRQPKAGVIATIQAADGTLY